MANRTFFKTTSPTPAGVTVGFNFSPNGSTTSLTASSFNGFISSVTRTNVGTYVVTFPNTFQNWLSGYANVATTQNGVIAQVRSYTASTGTATIIVSQNNSTTPVTFAAVDLPATPTTVVYCTMHFQNMNLTR